LEIRYSESEVENRIRKPEAIFRGCEPYAMEVVFTVKKKNIQIKPNYYQVLNLMFLVAEQILK
jgi:hypothetical protein